MKTSRRSARLIVILGLLLVSLVQVGLSSAQNKPDVTEIKTDVWAEATCQGGVIGIKNLSDEAGMTFLEVSLDGKTLVKQPIYLKAQKAIELKPTWNKFGFSMPLTTAHEIGVKTKDDQAQAKIGPCAPPAPKPVVGTITVHKFHDLNKNGMQDSWRRRHQRVVLLPVRDG